MDELDEFLIKRHPVVPEEAETKEEEVVDQAEETTEAEESTEEEVEQAEEQEETPVEFDIDSLTIDKKLAVASKLFGVDFKDESEVDAYKNRLSGLESVQKRAELIPKLVEKLKSSQDILSHFPDEKAYVAVQLGKREEYKGKESVIDKVLRSNLNELSSLEVIELAAKIEAPGQIRNPLRQKLLTSGLDPEAVSAGYDSLSEDEKDSIDYLAANARKSLSKLGEGIEIPRSGDMDVLAELEAEDSRSKDDLLTRRNNIVPIAKTLVETDLKEIPISDGFSYKLNLTNEAKQEYQDFITDAVMSGDYDLSTERGKADLWDAVIDLAFINERKKITPAYEKHIREDEQRKIRESKGNAKPFNKNEPAPPIKTERKVSRQAEIASAMISERE